VSDHSRLVAQWRAIATWNIDRQCGVFGYRSIELGLQSGDLSPGDKVLPRNAQKGYCVCNQAIARATTWV